MLAHPAAHAGMTHVLTGPQDVTYADVAAAIAGLRVEYESVEPGIYEARLLAAGLPAWRAFDLAHITAAYSPRDLEASPTLGALLGREPRSLSDFLADHRDAFRPAHS